MNQTLLPSPSHLDMGWSWGWLGGHSRDPPTAQSHMAPSIPIAALGIRWVE